MKIKVCWCCENEIKIKVSPLPNGDQMVSYECDKCGAFKAVRRKKRAIK